MACRGTVRATTRAASTCGRPQCLLIQRQLRAFGTVVARVRFWCDPRKLDPKAIDLLDLLIPQASLSVQRCFAGKEAQEDPLTGALTAELAGFALTPPPPRWSSCACRGV